MQHITKHFLSLALLTSAALPAQAVVFTVGADPTICNYSNLASAITQAAITPGNDEIHIAGNLTGVAVTIADANSIDVIGGYERCTSITPTGQSELTGTGSASVILVRGMQRVGLHNLIVRKGHSIANGGFGGGIQVTLPTKTLDLYNITAVENLAQFGAGLSVKGSPNQSILVLGSGVRLISNTAAQDGGGIYQTYALADISMLNASKNRAGRNGGGLMIAEGATLSNPVYDVDNGLFENVAKVAGGGVAIERGSQFVMYHAKDSAPAGQISFNEAQIGGGAYVMNNRALGTSLLATHGVNFVENHATVEGGAVAIRTSGTASAPIYAQATINDTSGPALRPCAEPLQCDVLEGNTANSLNGDKAGAVIAISNSGAGVGYATFRKVTMRKNKGFNIATINAGTPPAGYVPTLTVEDSLIERNIGSKHLINGAGLTQVFLSRNTFAANQAFGSVLDTPNYVYIVDGIFNDKFPVFANVPSLYYIDSILVKDPFGMPGVSNLIVNDANFEDEAGLNYQLSQTSEALDRVPAAAAGALDRAGKNRTVMQFDKINPRDLGCFERQ